MASNEPRQVVVTEQDGAVDSILTYLKERIESPFLMSFLFSWSVINRDFLFYLFMSDDRNKHHQLANWDFSGFLFGNCFYNSWTEGFWLPLFSSVIITLFFSSFSSVLSAGRYFFLKQCIAMTKEQKDGFDSVYEIKLQEIKLKELKAQVADLKLEADGWQEKNNVYKADFEKNKDPHLALSRGKVFDFLMQSAKFNVLYKTNHFSEIDGFKASSILPNAVINVSFFDKKDPKRDILQFEGTAYEFITNSDYFNWDDKDSIDYLFALLTTIEVNRPVETELNIGRIQCSLESSEQFT